MSRKKRPTRAETARLVMEAFESMGASIAAARAAGLDVETYVRSVQVMWENAPQDGDTPDEKKPAD